MEIGIEEQSVKTWDFETIRQLLGANKEWRFNTVAIIAVFDNQYQSNLF